MIVRKGYFDFGHIPRFSCPHCGTGQLRFEKNTLITRLPTWIRKLPEKSDYHDEHGEKDVDQNDIFENKIGEAIAQRFSVCKKS